MTTKNTQDESLSITDLSEKSNCHVNQAPITGEVETIQFGLLQKPANTYSESFCISFLLNNISLKHALCWILVMLIAASVTVLLISRLPWYNSSFPQNYFKENTYVLLEDTFQPFILCIIAPLTMSLMYAPQLSLIVLYQIGIPSLILFVSFFTIIYWVFDVSLVWYCVDGPLLCIQYILVCTVSIYRLAVIHKNTSTNEHHTSGHCITYNKYKLFKWVVVPITWLFVIIGAFGGPGLEFYLSLTPNYQYIFRLVVWPPLIQFTLGFAEKLVLKVSAPHSTNNSSKLHAVLLAQVVFAIYGRVMIFSGHNLSHAIYLAIGHCFQEILFHRWSRQICRINYEIKMRFINNICCTKCRSNQQRTFNEYFSSEKYKDYRSYIINIEYLIEIIGIVTTSLMFIAFYKYKYVFNFDFPLKHNDNGVDIEFVAYIGFIQILLEIVSYVAIAFIERRVNNVLLLRSWTKLNHLQMISSVLIIIEAVISSATVTRSVPNIINCTNQSDVCSCSFASDWNGCS